MKSKVVSGLLVLALSAGILLAGFAGTSRAKEPPDISDTYELDGLTYYNAKSTNFNSDKRSFVDLISAKHSSLGGHSIADMWLMTALGLGSQTALRIEDLPHGDMLALMAKEGILNGGIDDKKYGFLSRYSYEAPDWHDGYVTTELTVKYLNGELHMFVEFSDFSVGALLPADEGLYVQTVVDNGSVKSIAESSVKNDTADPATPTQDVTKSIAETLTSTVNHSSSYSFTEGVKASAEASSFGIYKMSIEMSAQFTQAFTDGWSKSESKTTSLSPKTGVSVSLPPYTCVLIKQGDADTTVTTKYNCPVFLSYKVRIHLSGGPMLSLGNYHFGSSSNARKDLYHRAFEDGAKQYDSESIDWVKVLADSDVKDAIQKISTHVPMSGAGATMYYTNKTTYTEVAGKTALYPLTSTQLGKSNIPFIDSNNVANMKIGNYSYVNYLTVNGLNAHNAPYYGFDSSAGSWVIVDDNGQEMAQGNAPIVLEKESVSGHTKFRAVKAGTCYLKYLINEKKYPTSYGADSYTKNSDLTGTAALRIIVAEEEVTYEVSGHYEGVVNSAAESIEGDDKLEVSVYDSTGKEVEGTYLWDKKERKGINLTADGMVSFTKGGTYHVRVKNESGTIYSDWTAISAEVLGGDYVEPRESEPPATSLADENTTLIIRGSYVGGLSCDENVEGDGKLQVHAFDSTGKEQHVAHSWEQKDAEDGMTIDEAGNVSFSKIGSYFVRVRSGNVYSDWAEIVVNEKAPARLTSLPSATEATYDGTAQTLLNEDARYEGGKIMYGLGKDSSTPASEYSTELPTAIEAGTYYVWVKVIGDETHESTEPVCVIATIAGDSAPDPEPEPQGVSSSSGGCDGGFSVLGMLGLMLSALMIRKAR